MFQQLGSTFVEYFRTTEACNLSDDLCNDL